MALTDLRDSVETVHRGVQRPAGRGGRPRYRPHPGLWRSPLRGPWLTSLLGTCLIPAVAIIAGTGFISHWAYHPELAGNATANPAYDLPVLFQFPASWPSWSYAVTQGTHVTLGLMTLPFILAKLWSVMPRLVRRPNWRDVAGTLERLSILLLVGSMLVEFATGVLYVDDSGGWSFSFYTVHYYGAWIFGTMFVLHAAVKLPTVRRAYRAHGVLGPLRQGLRDTAPEPRAPGGLAPLAPASPTVSRRGLLAMVGGASLTIFAVQAGESIGGPLRNLALLAPRGRTFGTGPNDFPVTHTAALAQVDAAMAGTHWRLRLDGRRAISLSRDDLLALPQTTHTLTITCTEGWSTTQHWTGVSLASLARLAGAAPGAVLRVDSVQQAYGTSFSHEQFSDERALLALRVNGEHLSLDHGYPARVILPNVPGTHNIKWVRALRFTSA